MDQLKGKVVIITGGATGLGKSVGELLLQKGCKVVLLDRNKSLGLKTTAELKEKYGEDNCVFYMCDVTAHVQMEDIFRQARLRFGRLDIVINNAATIGESNWRNIFAVNTEATYHGTLLGLKYMGTDRGYQGGSIINVASIAGLRILPTCPAYCASKYAVVAMTRAFGTSLHYNRHGVTVNCFCPGIMATDMWTKTKEELLKIPDTASLLAATKVKPLETKEAALALFKILEDGRNGAVLGFSPEGVEYQNFSD